MHRTPILLSLTWQPLLGQVDPKLDGAGDRRCRLPDLSVGGEAGAAVGEERRRVEQGLATGWLTTLDE
jgi:hypothetical protein